MALNKVRYIHRQCLHRVMSSASYPGKIRAITIRIAPTENPEMVEMSVAMCSVKDQFCKKTGREVADAAEKVTVHIRSIPAELAERERALRERRLYPISKEEANRWAWFWKYCL